MDRTNCALLYSGFSYPCIPCISHRNVDLVILMEKLLELLKDGHARTPEQLAIELSTSVDDVKRQMEYLENMGIIRKVSFQVKGCETCSGCPAGKKNDECSITVTSFEAAPCKGCLPDGGFKNMGQMWEVVNR